MSSQPWLSSRKRGNYQVRVWVDDGKNLIMYYEHDNWHGPLSGSLTCFKTEGAALEVYHALKVEQGEDKLVTFTKNPRKLDNYKIVDIDVHVDLSACIECAICKTTAEKGSRPAKDFIPSVEETAFFCMDCSDLPDFELKVKELGEMVVFEDDSSDEEHANKEISDDYKAQVMVDGEEYLFDDVEVDAAQPADTQMTPRRGRRDHHEFHKFDDSHGW